MPQPAPPLWEYAGFVPQTSGPPSASALSCATVTYASSEPHLKASSSVQIRRSSLNTTASAQVNSSFIDDPHKASAVGHDSEIGRGLRPGPSGRTAVQIHHLRNAPPPSAGAVVLPISKQCSSETTSFRSFCLVCPARTRILRATGLPVSCSGLGVLYNKQSLDPRSCV